MENLHRHSAVHLLSLLNSGQLSSDELTRYFINRIEQVNPSLNAVVVKLYDQALKAAGEADKARQEGKQTGRLAGLPFTIKECLDLPGTPSTLGLKRRLQDIPQKNDAYLETLQREGGVILGKTNVAQLLMYYESDNPVYGTTNNPYSARHSAGGSSGGEGAIIGAGASPVGIGTDIGGSLRIPAAFSGICSIKPTMDRTKDLTRFIERPIDIPIRSVTGVLANHAEDLQLFLQLLNETAGRMWPVQSLTKMEDVRVENLKVGYFLSDGLFEPMPAIKRALLESVERLKDQGVSVVEFQPPALDEAEALFFSILAADKAPIFTENLQDEKPMPQAAGLVMVSKLSPWINSVLQGVTALAGQKSLARILPYFKGRGPEFMAAMKVAQQNFVSRYLSAMDSSPIGPLDAIISPVCALPAYLHRTADKVGLGGAYAMQHNVTGFPAGVATVSKVLAEEAIAGKTSADLLVKTAAKIRESAAGLPLAVQISARPWQEHIVLALINQLHISFL